MIPSGSSHEVSQEQHRLRLDRFLIAVRPDLGRRGIDRLLRTGAVRVRGQARGAGYFVKHGDLVEVSVTPAALIQSPHEILHTPELLAMAKPPGMPTNPVRARSEGGVTDPPRSLLAWSIQHCQDVGIPGSPGIVHRLDRDTSGIVILSLTPRGHDLLEEAFRTRRIGKAYLALVCGSVHPRRGTIDLPLTRDRAGKMRVDPRGAPSRSDYRTLRSSQAMTLLEVRPRSGRMHQIRVHLASIGHPVAGDPLYGDPRRTLGAPRLWLHAEAIELPENLAATLGSQERITSPLWEDLQSHLRSLGFGSIRPGGEGESGS